MKSNPLMNFTVDKESKTVIIEREFHASLSKVWSAWTEPEILDQWWAPAPFKSQTKKMNFIEGGRRLYAMVAPDGQERWSFFDYTSISPKTNFKHTSTFCDAAENPVPNLGSSYWDVSFSEQNASTLVTITIKRDSLEELEKVIEMGFKEGITATLQSLATIIESEK